MNRNKLLKLGHIFTIFTPIKKIIEDLSLSKADKTEFNKSKQELSDKVDNKVDKIEGKGLSTNDYTTEEKQKLAGLKLFRYIWEGGETGATSYTGAQRFNNRNNIASAEYAHAEGYYTEASGQYSHAEGHHTTASGGNSHSEGNYTLASGFQSHAEGLQAKATNNSAHAEGRETKASGMYSHAEGYGAEASGENSHAEGEYTKASGKNSHAEGNRTKASGMYSHAEGTYSEALGQYSHAEGEYTIANSKNQHTQGQYNIQDSENKYSHIVGNGTALDARSNAHTIDWNGLGWFKNGVKVGGIGQDDPEAKTLATIEYVDVLRTDMGDMDDLSTANKTVVGAINEVFAAVGTGGTDSVITMTTNTTSEGALKSYTIKQGNVIVGVIDIPKDMVVEAGSVVVNPEGMSEGTYIKLVLANVAEPLYINVGTLVDIYKAKTNAAQIQVNINSTTREISAHIVSGSVGTTELANNAVTTVKIADANVTKAKLSAAVQASLDKADAAAGDATAKANASETNAKNHADDLNTAMDNRVKALESKVNSGFATVTDDNNGNVIIKFN